MSSDIITTLEIDKENLSSKIFVVKEINGCDSSFIISCVLGHFVKNKSAVLIISTHNSIKHYQNVGLKMNYNVNKCVDAGLIKFYNVGNEFVEKLLKNEHLSLDSIFESIKEKVEQMQHKYDMVNVIIDGISHLLNMQYNVRDVNTICSNIIDLVRGYKNSLLFLHCNVANELDVTHVVSNLLCHKAHMVLEVENLTSGWSADVSGHLTLKYPGRKFEDEYMFLMDLKPTQYLFKLFDRGVKLLAPGIV